jgi:hypothetical protein
LLHEFRFREKDPEKIYISLGRHPVTFIFIESNCNNTNKLAGMCTVPARIQVLSSLSFVAYFSTPRMEAANSWETLVNAYHIAQCHVPKDSDFISHLTA